ncbi:MAG: cyanophycinase [Gammaproteobacteria bacterium]|nr:cyanophycinase [Gammaproteobacteria bacterium]
MKKVLVLLLALACALPASAAKKNYTYVRVGNSTDVATATSPGIVLMGGSTDVDAAFTWMCDRAGSGDFLVIRATGTDAYNPYIQGLCPALSSVATLIIPSTAAANDPFVADTIAAAEAVFIAGGDQSNYVNYWTGTAVQAQLNALIARGVPVGGSRAGMMVLAQFVYSALLSQGVTSSQALADPFTKYLTLTRDFAAVQSLQGTIGDSHFAARDRMGRDLAFLCRIAANGWSGMPRSIAVDEETALLVDGRGGASVAGNGKVYFIKAPGPAEVCQPSTPLTYRNVEVYRISAPNGSFDLGRWSGRNGAAYKVSAEAGVLGSTQAGGSPY